MAQRLFALAIAIGILAQLGSTTLAQEKKAGPPDEKAMMEAMAKAATPGEPHKKLSALEGSWECTVKFWMEPGKPPSESKATSENKWILGGRYLEEKVVGEFGGMKFEGLGIVGYDNVQKRFHSTWFDNFGTGVETAVGKVSEDGKLFTFQTENVDPLTGKRVKGRDLQKIVDKDEYVSEMYKTMNVGGKELEMKVMEITYKRKK